MGSPFKSKERVKIDLIDDLWIEAKKELNYSDQRALRAPFMKVDADGDQIKTEVDLSHAEEGNPILIERAILAWNFVGEDGEIAEICIENIDNLDDDLAMLITQKLTALYKSITKKRKKA